MMNEEPELFELRLSRQPLRPVPAEWREEILREGRRAAALEIGDADTASLPERPWLSTFVSRLSSVLWPHPVAWAGLAAVWIGILAVDFSVRDQTPLVAKQQSPPSPQVMVELRQQQRLLAELIGPRDIIHAGRPKSLAPRPRSEHAEFLKV